MYHSLLVHLETLAIGVNLSPFNLSKTQLANQI